MVLHRQSFWIGIYINQVINAGRIDVIALICAESRDDAIFDAYWLFTVLPSFNVQAVTQTSFANFELNIHCEECAVLRELCRRDERRPLGGGDYYLGSQIVLLAFLFTAKKSFSANPFFPPINPRFPRWRFPSEFYHSICFELYLDLKI